MLRDDVDDSSPTPDQPRRPANWRLAFMLFAIAVVGIAYWKFGDALTLNALAEHESRLRNLLDSHPLLVCAVVFLVYVLVTGFSLPAAGALSLFVGWYLGFTRAVIVVSFASTAGATMAFLLSRFVLRDFIQRRFSERLNSFNAALQRDGAFYLFTLRLIPAVPFFAINAVMGLTKMKVRTFWWVSQLGMLPGTLVFMNAGASFPNLKTLSEQGATGLFTPQLLAGFALLGVFPILVKKIFAWLKPSPAK